MLGHRWYLVRFKPSRCVQRNCLINSTLPHKPCSPWQSSWFRMQKTREASFSLCQGLLKPSTGYWAMRERERCLGSWPQPIIFKSCIVLGTLCVAARFLKKKMITLILMSQARSTGACWYHQRLQRTAAEAGSIQRGRCESLEIRTCLRHWFLMVIP